MKKTTKKILIYLFAFFVSVSAFIFGYTYYTVTRETSERIEIGALDRVIASESPVSV